MSVCTDFMPVFLLNTKTYSLWTLHILKFSIAKKAIPSCLLKIECLLIIAVLSFFAGYL